MESLVIRDDIQIKLEQENLQESSMDKIKKEINDTESEEIITPSYNAEQIKLEHDEINIKRFSCKLCDKKLTSIRTLKHHMNKHTRENLVQCSECDKEYTTRGTLNQHLKNNHGNERLQFSCKLCDKKLATKTSLRHHINGIHTREHLFKCLECDREFTLKTNLKSHLKTHSKERLQTISQTGSERTEGRLSDVDGKSMNKSTTALSNIIKSEKMDLVETDLTENINTAKPELSDKRYECKICNKKFHFDCLLKRHMKSCHPDEKPYECSKCSEKFESKQNWIFHKLTHGLERMTFPCQFCNKELKTKDGLKYHLTIHTRKKNLFKCAHCQKEFKCKTKLIAHMKIHRSGKSIAHMKILTSGNLQFFCKLCDKKLASRCLLKRHINTHTREKLFKCSECNKEFTRFTELNRHLETHSKERVQFSCKFCDKKLTSKRTLKHHMNKHTRENLVKCSECDKEYTTRGTLNQHLKNNHGKERLQFSCKLCNKKLSTKCGLKHHINNIHTREHLFKCSECNKEFTLKTNLNSHLKTHSKERLQKISQTSSERTGGRLSDVDGKSMNKSITALSNIIKSEKMDLVETDLTEYINNPKPELNTKENESSHLVYNTCYSETICKEEVILSDEND